MPRQYMTWPHISARTYIARQEHASLMPAELLVLWTVCCMPHSHRYVAILMAACVMENPAVRAIIAFSAGENTLLAHTRARTHTHKHTLLAVPLSLYMGVLMYVHVCVLACAPVCPFRCYPALHACIQAHHNGQERTGGISHRTGTHQWGTGGRRGKRKLS